MAFLSMSKEVIVMNENNIYVSSAKHKKRKIRLLYCFVIFAVIVSSLFAVYHIWYNRDVNIYEKNLGELKIKYIPKEFNIFTTYETPNERKYVYKTVSYDKTLEIYMGKAGTRVQNMCIGSSNTEKMTINGCEATLTKDINDDSYSISIDIGYNFISVTGDIFDRDTVLKIAENIK